MKKADRAGASYVLIIGDEEMKKGSAILRNMKTKSQEDIPIQGVLEVVKKKLSDNI